MQAGLEDVLATGAAASRTSPRGRRPRARARRRACEVPAALACLKTSPQRSTPGPLAVPHARTRRRIRAFGNRLTCCVPQIAVAARSSFTPGWNLTWWLSRCFLRAPQRLVEAAERRAAIAGNEAGGVEPGALVALALQHQQADQRLRAGEEDAAALERVLVVEGSCGEARDRWEHFMRQSVRQPARALIRGCTRLRARLGARPVRSARSQYGSGPNDSARKSMNTRVFAGR